MVAKTTIGKENIFTKSSNIKEPSDKKFIFGMLTPASIVFIIGIAFPLILAFYISIANSTDANFWEFPPTKFLNGSQWLGNFAQFLEDGHLYTNTFYQYFYQTVFFVVLSVSIELGLGMLFALIVNRKFRGRALARASLLVPWALPTVVSALVFRELFAPKDLYGFVNEFLSIVGIRPVSFYGDPSGFNFGYFALPIPSNTFPFFTFHNFVFSYAMITLLIIEVWKTTPFIALLILAALQTVPDDLYKAADIEGATPYEKFRYITLPMIKAPLLIAVLFRLIDAVRIYDSVVTLRDQTVYSVTVVAVRAWTDGNYGVSAAIAIIELLMLVFFAIAIFKMSKNRLLFAFAGFLFFYDRLIPLTIELVQLFANNSAYIWLFFVLVAAVAFRKYTNKIIALFIGLFPDLHKYYTESNTNKFGYLKYLEYLLTIIVLVLEGIAILVAFLLFSIIYSSILSKYIIFLIVIYLIIPILSFYKFRPKLDQRNEKIFSLTALVLLIIFTITQILNQISFSNNNESFFEKMLSYSNSITYTFEIIFLLLLFIVQIYYLATSRKIIREFSINSSWFYILQCLVMGFQVYTILMELITDLKIPLPGFILTNLPIQDTLDMFGMVVICALTLAIINSLYLAIKSYILSIQRIKSSKKNTELTDEINHDMNTYIGITLIMEVILYIELQNVLQIFLIINFIFIFSIIYYLREKIKKYGDKLENGKLNYILIGSFIVVLELFIFNFQDIYLITFLNFSLLVIGIYLFRSTKEYESTKSGEFKITINQRLLLRRNRINRIGFGLLVTSMLLFTLGPFLWMINRSFRNPCRSVDSSQLCYTAGPTQNSFELSPFLKPSTFSLQGYDIVLNSNIANLIQALINGFIVSGLTAIIVVIIGSLVAVILSKYHFKGENYVVLLIFSMSSLPPIIILIPYLIQIFALRDLGINIFGFQLQKFVLILGPLRMNLGSDIGNLLTSFKNGIEFIPFIGPNLGNFFLSIFNSSNGRLLSLVLPYVAFNLPLGVFLIRSFFQNIPDELIKAAKVDGASNFQIFRKILLPLTKPGIFTTALMVFIQAWNELLFASIFLVGDQGIATVPMSLLKFLLSPSQLANIKWIPQLILATGSVVATVPLIILVLILQRYIISGITSGAVKG